MFKIDLSATFFFPVTVEIPEDGKHKKVTFDAEFNRLTKTETKEIFARIPGLNPDKEVDSPISDEELLQKVFCGWKGVVDGDGAAVLYSETARERVLEITGVSNAIVSAWLSSLAGSEAKRKN